MKRLAIAVMVTVLAIGAAGCGNDNPTNPSSNLVVFTVPLSALNEVPPVSNAEATARGTAVITINKTTNMIDFEVSLNSFPDSSVVRIAHIHGPAPVGVNASILVDTTLAPGVVALTNGAGTFRFPSIQATAAQVTQILGAPQNHYFNVHTVLNGGGAVRGQLQ
jgi:hypothetical protein